MSQVDNMLPEHANCAHNVEDKDSDGELNMERIPFAKNTFRMDIKHQNFLSNDKLTYKVLSSQNKENMNAAVNKIEHQDNLSESLDNEIIENNNNRPITPANDPDAGSGQPLTPTANLKVLYNAMSPELRNREEQKRDTSDEDAGDSPGNSQQQDRARVFDNEHSDYQFETIIELTSSQEETDHSYGPSRKDKSLGLLCQKFLQKYPEYPKEDEIHDICLDEVAKELNVERRRIYDIVNVLESVEIVSRLAKNRYAWHGKSNLRTTLAKLKALGESEGFGEQIQKLKDFEFNRELEHQLGKFAPKKKPEPPDFSKLGENSLLNQAALRKDKSLGIMSQKFLMLFLVSKPKTVNLDLSAKLLIGDANIDMTANAKFKTKIRRLYDIANILTSLDLIRKVHVTEIRGRKPAFKYVGPDIDNNEEFNNMWIAECCSDGVHRPCSRHSMLDCIQNQEVSKIIRGYQPIKPESRVVTQMRAAADEERPISANSDSSPSKLKFGRHSSFDQICAVAEQERNKLYASASEPASPTHDSKEFSEKLKLKLNARGKEVPTETKQFVIVQSPDGNFQFLNGKGQGSEMPQSANTSKLPTKGFVRKKSQQKIGTEAKPKTTTGTEAIIIKTPACKPTLSSGKQPTVIPLTKDQIDAVLRSLKVPIPINKDSTPENDTKLMKEYYEELTEDGITKIQVADMKEVNEKTPIVINDSSANVKCSNVDSQIPVEKRVRLDFPSPVSGDDSSPFSSQENVTVMRLKRKHDEIKPSPQRALHLTPEFNKSPVKKIRIEVTPAGDAFTQDLERGVKVQTIDKSTIQTVQTLKTSPSITQLTQSHGSKTVAVQLSNQPTTVFHVPIINVQGSQPGTQPVTAVGQQVIHTLGNQAPNIVVPCTFSPPLTPNSGPGSPKIFSFSNQQSSSNITLTNVHLVQPSVIKVQSPGAGTTLIRPIATKPTLSPNPGSQIVPPQIVTPTSIIPSASISNKAQGGFVPITGSISNGSTKVIITQQPTNSEKAGQ